MAIVINIFLNLFIVKQLVLLFFLFFSSYTFSQVEQIERYKLYPTDNMYNFINLDTATGIMTLVQWSLESDSRFVYKLSYEILLPDGWVESTDEEMKYGRFKLYPTSNTYNFLLLDTENGRTWQVQWGFEKDERFVIEIE